jgi:AraC-like DNA-binding protein
VLQAAPETFRTDAVGRSGRLAFWNDVATRTFGDIAVDPLDRDFAGQLKRVSLANLTLANVWSSPARVNGAAAARLKADGWFFLLNERGTSRLRQLTREVYLRPGELTVLRADERYQIEFMVPNRTLVLHLPGNAASIDLESHIACKHAVDDVPLFTGMMRQIERASRSSNTHLAQLASLVTNVAALCWPTQLPSRRRHSILAWEQRFHAHIADNLRDRRLSAASIAQRFGISTRFVHMVLAQKGETAGHLILERRLSTAAMHLRSDPVATVTEVAFDAGFEDLSHFCRAFKRRFGLSARKYRDT